MNKFLVNYKSTNNNMSKKGLVKKHVDYIKSLYKNKTITFAAVFKSKPGAMLIFNASSYEEVENFLQQDPFIEKNIYEYVIEEIIEGNEDNNFLLGKNKTKSS